MHPHGYRIIIGGGMSIVVRRRDSRGFKIQSDGAYTTPTADLDQAALYGALSYRVT